MKLRDLSVVNFKDYFKIDPDSPSGLTWIKESGNTKRKIGDVVGKKTYRENSEPKCWVLWLHGKPYIAHRVILELAGFLLNAKLVDHIDGNPFNNNLSNLRVADSSINNKNRKKSKNNKTGVTGVTYLEMVNKQGKVYNYYVAQYHEKGKEITKYFNIDKLGKLEAMRLAIEFREKGLENDPNYSERHGK